jgi:peptidoglycan/xylan/chitin deacetylase (PgdA/CDA1 family)
MTGAMPAANRLGALSADRDLVGYGRQGAQVQWPDGARIAVNLVINYEEGAEYSTASGDAVSESPPELAYPSEGHDLATESIFDYGSRAGVWRLQRLLDEYELPATFFGVARAFELNPEVGAYVQEAGHDVCCHGLRWERVDMLSEDEERSRIAEAVESILKTCGQRPDGWYCRAPASPNTRRLVAEEGGFLYDSDSFADDVPYFVPVGSKQHLVIPYSFVTNDSKFAPGQSYSSPSSFLDDIKRAFDYLWREGETAPKLLTVGLHPRIVGQPARASVVREFIEHVLGHDRVWLARRSDIAQWWLQNYGT